MIRGRPGRRDKLIKQERHDVYREVDKWTEPTRCAQCSAVFTNGRWCWNQPREDAKTVICPACRRIVDNYPAGRIEMSGEFFEEHREEILNLVRNIEEQEKGEHPLERIMSITDGEDSTIVTTTGLHIARRIGEALSRAYKGDYTFQYADAEKHIRVFWSR